MSAARQEVAEAAAALAVGLGGMLGGGLRWSVSALLPHSGPGFPWATFVENVSGSLVLAAVMVLILETGALGRGRIERYARPFLAIGVLGGYTTFSTFAAETIALTRSGATPVAVAYVTASLAVGLVAVWVGLRIGGRLARWRIAGGRR